MRNVTTAAKVIKCMLSQLWTLTKLKFKFQVGEPAEV